MFNFFYSNLIFSIAWPNVASPMIGGCVVSLLADWRRCHVDNGVSHFNSLCRSWYISIQKSHFHRRIQRAVAKAMLFLINVLHVVLSNRTNPIPVCNQRDAGSVWGTWAFCGKIITLVWLVICYSYVSAVLSGREAVSWLILYIQWRISNIIYNGRSLECSTRLASRVTDTLGRKRDSGSETESVVS